MNCTSCLLPTLFISQSSCNKYCMALQVQSLQQMLTWVVSPVSWPAGWASLRLAFFWFMVSCHGGLGFGSLTYTAGLLRLWATLQPSYKFRTHSDCVCNPPEHVKTCSWWMNCLRGRHVLHEWMNGVCMQGIARSECCCHWFDCCSCVSAWAESPCKQPISGSNCEHW